MFLLGHTIIEGEGPVHRSVLGHSAHIRFPSSAGLPQSRQRTALAVGTYVTMGPEAGSDTMSQFLAEAVSEAMLRVARETGISGTVHISPPSFATAAQPRMAAIAAELKARHPDVPVIAFPSKMAYGPQMVMLYLLGFVGAFNASAYSGDEVWGTRHNQEDNSALACAGDGDCPATHRLHSCILLRLQKACFTSIPVTLAASAHL